MRLFQIIGILSFLVILLCFPFYIVKRNAELAQTSTTGEQPEFIGSDSCKACHEKEYQEWLGSHHERAMDIATEKSVLGDFNNSDFTRQGVRSTFYSKNGKFFVHTQGENGVMADFEISHTFGWYPLQQYLVPFPGGRLQCLPIAWDSRDNKWFHLYGEQKIEKNEWHYWTNPGQTWNAMCADCHSTNLLKNFDKKTNTYNTRWSEINVGCEACHGPGAKHILWANLPKTAREDRTNGLSVQTSKINNRQQVESCMLCHSRRSVTGDFLHGQPDLLDSMTPRLLLEGLYYPDGQIQEEVYVYGSFVQSQMYANDVLCSDCHNIHNLKLHAEGNKLCLQCHEARFYDSKAHHFHKTVEEKGEAIRDEHGKITFAVGTGAECVACHMPGQTYMGNDYRPDHSLRIPRPDLSVALGIPNSCNRCHADKDEKWAAEFTRKWYGEQKRFHYGELFKRARDYDAGVKEELVALFDDRQFPLIVRATALSFLGRFTDHDIPAIFRRALTDNESLIRHTALLYLPRVAPELRTKLCLPLLNDSVKSVRIEAARNIAMVHKELLSAGDNKRFTGIVEQLQEVLNYSSDFAEARLNLGTLASLAGDQEQAEKELKQALVIDPYFTQAYANLAVIFSRQGELDKAAAILRDGIQHGDANQSLHFSLGLLLAEQKKYPEAMAELEKATETMQNNPRLFYNLAQLQIFMKKEKAAKQSLKHAIAIEPTNIQYLETMLRWQLETGELETAAVTAENILRISPAHPLALQVQDAFSHK